MKLPKPYYDDGQITIYHGDCREVAPTISADVVVSDPPYGMNWDTNTDRFSGGSSARVARRGSGRSNQDRVAQDDRPFDPSPWLAYSGVVLFGSNHFGASLPVGTTLVWLKRSDVGLGSFLSDAELAWRKGGCGVYCFRDLSMTANANSRQHPCQKPIPLMMWCIEKAGPGTVLDPYMGSGTTLVAAKQLGRRAIGIELEEKYCEIAARRLAQGVLPL